MSSDTDIQFLQHHQIDKKKYDECITAATNGPLYAKSFYLDNMSPGWSAVIDKNYNWVMPLPWRKKLGCKYLYQPAFTQQLGLFYRTDSVVPWANIVEVIRKKYSFWEVNFNYYTKLPVNHSNFIINPATNFVISLNTSHRNLYANYHKDVLKNLKRSEKFRLVYRPSKDYSNSIKVYIDHYGERMKHVTKRDYENFRSICAIANETKVLICRDAVNQRNELMATILLLADDKRLYNLMNTTTEEGRKVEANYFLLDSVFREFGGQQLTFDFEGSDLPGVKKFYENFGAVNEPYFMVRYNNLPWPLKLLK